MTTAARDTDRELRLNRFLAEAGVASRRKADALIARGVVKVNGAVATDLGRTVIPSQDIVTVDGREVTVTPQLVYILLNKPKDCITTTDDEKGRRTVLDLVPSGNRLYPVGRLDRNTTGVLLLTNDGDLAYAMTHPRFHVEKMYRAELDRGIDPRHLGALRRGVELDDGMTAPCDASAIDPPRNTVIVLTLHEGRNRQVRRMFESFGYTVRKLERVAYAGLTTDGLARGAWRYLEDHEVRALQRLTKSTTRPRR